MPLLAKRRALDETTTLAIATTVEVTNLLRDRTIPEIAGQLRITIPAITTQFGEVAAVVSANDYNIDRSRADLPTEYVATPQAKPVVTATQAAVGFGIAQLTKEVPYEVFQSTLAGSVQRLVMQGDRDTVEFNIVTDPDGTSYERVPSPGACAFCMTMAAVATDSGNLRSDYFDKYHNFCRCTIRPIFTGGSPTELPEYKQAREAYSLANKELVREREPIEQAFRKEFEADYRRNNNGTNPRSSTVSKAFFKEHPDLTYTTENILRNVRKITGQK
jgi:hypothetical protein